VFVTENPEETMKHVLLILLTATFMCGQDKPASRTLDITLVSVIKMNVGEAYDCPSIDMQWLEAHCFPPTKENLNAPKHKYLVTATFDKPLEADKNGWAWDFTCRLDSHKTATCRVNKATKSGN